MRERVAILGANGFIGRALRRRLAPRFELISVDWDWDKPGSFTLPEERLVRSDITSRAAIDDLLDAIKKDEASIAGVLDLVAHYDFRNESDPRYGAVEEGLEYLLKELGNKLPEETPFLFASSMAALAPTEPGRPLSEESPRLGAWAYPAHKLRCEAIIEESGIPQPRAELVLAGVYSDWCELVPLYFHLERVRGSGIDAYMYPGRTDRGLTYIHVDEVARAFELSIDRLRGRAGIHRFLIGESKATTYAEIQRVAAKIFESDAKRALQVPALLAKTGAALLGAMGAERFVQPWMVDFAGEHFEFDLTRARRELGWSPNGDLMLALPKLCGQAVAYPEEWRSRNEARPR